MAGRVWVEQAKPLAPASAGDGGPDLVLEVRSELGAVELAVDGLGIVLCIALFESKKNANPAPISQQ
jgi:hypothetical protein